MITMIARTLAAALCAAGLAASGFAAAADPSPTPATAPAATASAAPAAPASSGAQAANESPDVVIRTSVDRARSLIRENYATYIADQSAFYRMVDTEIVPHFDVQFIAQFVLGKYYREATPDQRARFAEAFKNMLVRSYANALLEYHDSVDAKWKPTRLAEDAADALVQSTLIRSNGPPVPLDFRVRRNGNGGPWLIYDISVEGVSLAANFRGQFTQEIRTSGLDSLINKLEATPVQRPGESAPLPQG